MQVDVKKVVEHVCDTAGHLLKPRVTLEKMVDQTTPLIAGDGSRIVQVYAMLYPEKRVGICSSQLSANVRADITASRLSDTLCITHMHLCVVLRGEESMWCYVVYAWL